MKTIGKFVIAAALLGGVAFGAQASGCKANRATGQTVCVLSGIERGWDANAQMAVIDGQPFLVLLSGADTGRINATEVSLRAEGGEPYRLPVHAGTSSSNCFWGTVLVGSCMPTAQVAVKLDAATLDKLASAPATYVAATDGNAIGPNVKIKQSQVRAWLKQLPRYGVQVAVAP